MHKKVTDSLPEYSRHLSLLIVIDCSAFTAYSGSCLQPEPALAHSPQASTRVALTRAVQMSMQMKVTGFIVIAVEKKLFMKQNLLIASMLVLDLIATVRAAETAYQWTDRQGQIHYGDAPPASVNSRPIVLQQGSERVENQTGLRPGERERIVLMEKRQRMQHQRAQKARTRTDKQRTARRTDCANNREMLNISRGRDNFKQYARFLRSNCW